MHLPGFLILVSLKFLSQVFFDVDLRLPQLVLLSHGVLDLDPYLFELLPLLFTLLEHLKSIEELPHLPAHLLSLLSLHLIQVQGLQELALPLGRILCQLVGLQGQLLDLLL